MYYDEKPMGVVYYLNLRQLAGQRLQEKIEQVEEKMEQTRRDIKVVQDMQEALSKVEEILGEMRKLAVAATQPDADREVLQANMDVLKRQLEHIAMSPEVHDERFEEIRRILRDLGV